MRWCYRGNHEALRYTFIFKDQEYSECNQCAKRKHDIVPSDLKTQTLDDQAVPADHWKLIEKFNSELDKLERLPCDVCNEIDFDMGIKETNGLNECKRCRLERKEAGSNFIAKFSKENDMDPGTIHLPCLSIVEELLIIALGPLPSCLPQLSIAEEMLIARAHVHMDFRRVKGCQYKYSGHVVNFMQNTAKIINRLPSLPTELQVVILKPSSSTVNDSAVHREFGKAFRVQRKNVEMWLDFLIIHHPDYRDIVIDQERLSQLPGDATVIDAFSTVLHDEADNNDTDTYDNEAVDNKIQHNHDEHLKKEETPIQESNLPGKGATVRGAVWFKLGRIEICVSGHGGRGKRCLYLCHG